MPSMLTHCLCGDIAVNRTGNEHLMKAVREYPGAFHCGCQGPDLFAFYHVVSFSKDPLIRTVHSYSSIMHNEKINSFLEKLCEKAGQYRNDAVTAYASGFLCHHALDSNAHPLVYYRTDSLDKSRVGYDHQFYESQIDRGMLDHKKITLREYQPQKLIREKKEVIKEISVILSDLLKEVYGWELQADAVEDCFRDMVGIEKLIYNPTGKRYGFIDKLESLVGLKGLGTSMVIPVKYDDKLDAMNYRRDHWIDPVTGEARDEDFLTLFDNAVAESVLRFDLLDAYVNGDGTLEPIMASVADRTYDTGHRETEKKYFWKDGVRYEG